MRPICLPFEDTKSKSYEGEEVRVIGWGFMRPQVPRSQNGKYKVYALPLSGLD